MITKITSIRLLQHILFWGFSFYTLLNFFASDHEITTIDYIYTFLFHLTLLISVYINLFILIPTLLSAGKYFRYFVGLLVTVILCAQLNILFFSHGVDFIFPGYYFISYYDFIDISRFFIVYLGLTTLLKFSKAWFLLADSEKKLSLAMQEKLDAELNALKSQINPHFLFNSLNNLYGLSLRNDKKASTFILKLSEVMRYMIYEVNENFVPLKNEIHFIENYVDLQKIRAGSQANISLILAGNIHEQRIAPLLFIPFIENSFKHGIQGNIGAVYVRIKIEIKDKDLVLEIENNKGTCDVVEKKAAGGVGLNNVCKRLQLIYPGNHTLVIEDKDQFRVQLHLNI